MRALIFDFDGTIADSFATMVDLFEELTKRKQKLTAKEIEKLRGQKLSEILKYLKIRGWQIPPLLIKGRRAMAGRIADIKPFKGLVPVLKDLHSGDYQMFIISTNSPENINKFLKGNGMDGYFSRVYGDVGVFSKASALKKVLKREKITRNEAVYIGDEVRDIEAAHKLNITSIAVGWGFSHPKVLNQAEPDVLAVRPSDLPKILQKLKP